MIRLTFLLILFCFHSTFATVNKIIAVVNDQAITSFDLEQAKKLFVVFNKLQKLNAEDNKKLEVKALEYLIAQVLLNEQAKLFQMTISAEEVNANIKISEKQNNLPEGFFLSQCNQNQLDYKYFQDKIKTNLITQKIQQGLLSNITISQDSIEQVVINNFFKPATFDLKIFTTKDTSAHGYNQLAALYPKVSGCSKLPKMPQGCSMIESSEEIANLNSYIRTSVQNLAVNDKTPILQTDKGLVFILVGHKTVENLSPEQKEFITNSLISPKIHAQMQRLYATQRLKAYIQIYN